MLQSLPYRILACYMALQKAGRSVVRATQVERNMVCLDAFVICNNQQAKTVVADLLVKPLVVTFFKMFRHVHWSWLLPGSQRDFIGCGFAPFIGCSPIDQMSPLTQG